MNILTVKNIIACKYRSNGRLSLNLGHTRCELYLTYYCRSFRNNWCIIRAPKKREVENEQNKECF